MSVRKEEEGEEGGICIELRKGEKRQKMKKRKAIERRKGGRRKK